MYVSYGIIKSISVVHPSFRSSYVISCYLWGTFEPNHIITCHFTNIHVITKTHTKLHPLTSSLLLRVQACLKFGEKLVCIKFTKKIPDQVEHIFAYQKLSSKKYPPHRSWQTSLKIQSTNLTGMPTRCIKVTLDIDTYSEMSVSNVCRKTDCPTWRIRVFPQPPLQGLTNIVLRRGNDRCHLSSFYLIFNKSPYLPRRTVWDIERFLI
jgi:hypothetical protein